MAGWRVALWAHADNGTLQEIRSCCPYKQRLPLNSTIMITIEIGQLFWEGILIKVSRAQVTDNQTLFGLKFSTGKKRYIFQHFILYILVF